MNKALLDTNMISYFLRGQAEVVAQFAQYSQHYNALTFSILTYYELKSGLLYRDARRLMAQFAELATESEILPLSVQTMDIASEIYRDLPSRGVLIPPIDLFIAATALEYDLVMVTANTRHFENMRSLTCENWAVQS